MVELPHDLVDDDLQVTADIKLLNPELDSDAEAADKCFIFCHIVGCVEVQGNHV
jgi:hypothetical protein